MSFLNTDLESIGEVLLIAIVLLAPLAALIATV